METCRVEPKQFILTQRYDRDIDVAAVVVSSNGSAPESRVWSDRVTVPEFEVVSNPTVRISEVKRRRFNVIDRAQQKARQEIQAQEDARVYDIPVVIDVFASWCGPCQQVAPIFDELAKELAGQYKLVKINIDEERDLAIKYNVSSIPTFLFFKKGEVIGKEMGYMSKDDLAKKIKELLG